MPSGLNAETYTRIMVGPAVLKVAGVPWGVSRGGIRYENGAVIRNVPFDGKVADIAGLDRVVSYVQRVTGTFLQLGPSTLALLEHGTAGVVVGSVTETTPVAAQTFFVAGSYVTDLELDFQQPGGDIIQI